MGTPTRKLFIAHAEDDYPFVKKYIMDRLQAELKKEEIECVYACNSIFPGENVIAKTADIIQHCHTTFVILSENSMKKQWIKYETLLALEKSQLTRRLCLTIILLNLKHSDVNGQFFGVLSNAMTISVDYNKDSWCDQLKEDIKKKFYEKCTMERIQVQANLSVGQVWSHFTGYGKIVLPVLADKIRKSRWYQKNPGRFPLVEFNLIPLSAAVPSSLENVDSKIKHEGKLEAIIASRGSFGDRPYEVTVYSIEDEDGQEYYFVAQVPNTIGILGKLEHDPSKWMDSQLCAPGKQPPNLQISSGERALQVARFEVAYNRLVNHPKNEDCNNMLRLLCYDDSKLSCRDVLLKAIKQELSTNNQPPQTPDTFTEKTVFIDYLESSEQDSSTASELTQFLEAHGFTVRSCMPGQNHFEVLEKAMSKSKWLVFILSSRAIHSDRMMTFKYRAALHEGVENFQVRVIPLLDGIAEDNVTADLRPVTVLSKQETNYKEKLIQILNSKNISMDAIVSSKDVYQGLAWAYVLNYLSITLDDHIKKLKEIQGQFPDCKVYMKMFIIVPSSCATKSLKSLDKNERDEIIDEKFKQRDEITFTVKNVGGVIERKYQLITYTLKTPDQEYIVAVEYPNSVLCLQEMSKLQYLSGLKEDNLHDEAWRFKELSQAIIDCSIVTGKAKLLYYDDSRFNVADAMLEVMDEEFGT